MIKKWVLIVIFNMMLMPSAMSADRMIAITIDDLPFVGDARQFHLNKIIKTLTQYAIPATGFIIASEVRKSDYPVLQRFRDAGLELGNHSMTHANANSMPLNNYLAEIETSDALLSSVMTTPKYYRFPYLAEGRGENKKTIANLLKSKGYQVAPVTIDSKDYKYNQLLMAVPEWERRQFLSQLKPIYLDYIWKQTKKAEKSIAKNKPQILLVHANLLTTYTLPDIIAMFQSRGYRFVTLQEALNGRYAKGNASVDGTMQQPPSSPMLDAAASWRARFEAIIEHPPRVNEVPNEDHSWLTPENQTPAQTRIDHVIENAFAWDD